MKLGQLMMAVTVAGALTASADPTMFWGSEFGLSGTDNAVWRLLDATSTPIPTSSDWFIGIYNVANLPSGWQGSSTAPAIAAVAPLWSASPGFWSAFSTAGQGGEMLTASNAWLGLTVATIAFNNSSPGAASMYGYTMAGIAPYAGVTNLAWLTAPPQPDTTYLVGKLTWVPEPAAAGFILAGLGALLVRRIRRRN